MGEDRFHLTKEGNGILEVRYDYISLTLFIDVGSGSVQNVYYRLLDYGAL
jgi:hypothetical protein